MTKKLIAQLGSRFPPSSRSDEEGRAMMLGLLCRDVADIPPPLLGRAIDKWSKVKSWMPKAAELIAYSREIAANDQGRWRMHGETIAQRTNYAILFEHDFKHDRGMHWEGDHICDGAPTLNDCFPDRVAHMR